MLCNRIRNQSLVRFHQGILLGMYRFRFATIDSVNYSCTPLVKSEVGISYDRGLVVCIEGFSKVTKAPELNIRCLNISVDNIET